MEISDFKEPHLLVRQPLLSFLSHCFAEKHSLFTIWNKIAEMHGRKMSANAVIKDNLLKLINYKALILL